MHQTMMIANFHNFACYQFEQDHMRWRLNYDWEKFEKWDWSSFNYCAKRLSSLCDYLPLGHRYFQPSFKFSDGDFQRRHKKSLARDIQKSFLERALKWPQKMIFFAVALLLLPFNMKRNALEIFVEFGQYFRRTVGRSKKFFCMPFILIWIWDWMCTHNSK